MQKLLTLIVISTALTACGKEIVNNNTTFPNITTVQNQSVTPTTIEQIVEEQNALREAEGEDPLTLGLDCDLYTVPTSTTQIIGATLNYVGSFEYLGDFNVQNSNVSTGLSILPTNIQSIYQSWIILKCNGTLIVADNNYHEFDLSSDDGANLYIDGLLINNDGLHSIQTKSAAKFLGYGIHSFELDFFQASGMQALILNEDGDVTDSSQFYH
jgi:hypothetical protein